MPAIDPRHRRHRRHFLSACLGAASLPLGGAQALAQSAVSGRKVRIGYALPADSHYGAGARAWDAAVKESLGDAFAFEHFPSSALGGERDLIESLQLGVVEAAMVSTGATSNFVPEVGVVDIPFLFRDTAHARQALDGALGQQLLEKFREKSLVALAWGEQGFRHLTNNKRPVRTVEDLRGLKIRVTENPVHITAFRAFGATPTPMAWPEVVPALQQGTMDGQENPIAVLTSAKLWQVQKHLSLSAHVYAPAVMLLSRQFWASLDEAQQAAFAAAAQKGAAASRAYVDAAEQKGVQLARDNGMQVEENIDPAPFRAALEAAYKEYAKKFGQSTLDAFSAGA